MLTDFRDRPPRLLRRLEKLGVFKQKKPPEFPRAAESSQGDVNLDSHPNRTSRAKSALLFSGIGGE